jgi:transcriptional regulator with GAF, ATPase, and Fis domain
VHYVTTKSPIDYASIFEAVDGVLAAVIGKAKTPPQLSISLSSGTPAMAAIWVLLGKSKYPATFFQTHKEEVIPTAIPFDLMVDYLPAVLHSSDQVLAGGALGDSSEAGFGEVIGRSPPIKAVIARARRIALRDVSVLLLGESGVGKDVFARSLHAASRRASKAFVALNCAAVPKDLLASELFGHKKGAFTGADADRPGAFEQADGGTLFLDEVGECDLVMQASLLRVLQPRDAESPTIRRFQRLGEARERTTDVRVIAATNRDLQAEVAAGRFREDLYYRLCPFVLKIPPLRDRPADIALIAAHLLGRINADFARSEPGYQNKSLSVGTNRLLAAQPWPGNVRQLYNVLLQAAVMADGPKLEPRDIEPALTDGPAFSPTAADPPLGDGFSLKDHLEAVQRRFLEKAMLEAQGNKSAAAKLLGYDNYQTLAAQLKRFGIEWSEA